MSVLNGIATLVALLTFIGIVWWAFSRGRSQANRDASLLPFALPDEAEQAAEEQANETEPSAQQDANKEAEATARSAGKKEGRSHE